MDDAIFVEQLLNTIPPDLLNNRFVQSRISLSFVSNLANVNEVPKDQIQVAA
jgi:hypothetical protein